MCQGHAKKEKQLPTDLSSSLSMLVQFKFIAHIAQYVKYITQLLGPPKRPGHDSLPDSIPLLGPRFLPPTPHLLSKHRKIPLMPDAYYVCPIQSSTLFSTHSAFIAQHAREHLTPWNPFMIPPIMTSLLLNDGTLMDLIVSMVLMMKNSCLGYSLSAKFAKHIEI